MFPWEGAIPYTVMFGVCTRIMNKNYNKIRKKIWVKFSSWE